MAVPPLQLHQPPSPEHPNVFAGTRWRLTQANVVVIVSLKSDGTYDEQAASPIPGKRLWKSPDQKSITMEFQHNFLGVTFEGELVDPNTLQGVARDRNGKKWNWTAERLPEGNQGE